MYQRILNSPFLPVVVVVLMLVAIFGGALVLTVRGFSLSPIEQAIAACSTPDQQPAWVTEENPNVKTTSYPNYEYYSTVGKVEVWEARVKSAIYGGTYGRIKYYFMLNDSIDVEQEYNGKWGAHWEEPMLSSEEYQLYLSSSQAALAQLGRDEKWRGVSQVFYTLLFDPRGYPAFVECPGGAHVDLSQVK